ncbi:hypothetical protein AGLY_005644 [Aphis glycines]|uniref:Uncharacterized protein n=1 Tax=Aphis glycines TaxID=307491 RepID=A0A6G0TTI5_APHGL|nr:hypothetical protein AGLY_005644 [Aphis glycines]
MTKFPDFLNYSSHVSCVWVACYSLNNKRITDLHMINAHMTIMIKTKAAEAAIILGANRQFHFQPSIGRQRLVACHTCTFHRFHYPVHKSHPWSTDTLKSFYFRIVYQQNPIDKHSVVDGYVQAPQMSSYLKISKLPCGASWMLIKFTSLLRFNFNVRINNFFWLDIKCCGVTDFNLKQFINIEICLKN